MKRNITYILLAIFGMAFWACSDENDGPFLVDGDNITGETNINLIAPESGGSYILREKDADKIWETFSWEDANDVPVGPLQYYIEVKDVNSEIDTTIFIGPYIKQPIEVTEGELNRALIGFGYTEPNSQVDITTRVKQVIGDEFTNLEYYSTIISASIIGYGGQDPSVKPQLWAVGAALPQAGWGWASPVVLVDENREDIFRTPEVVELTSEGDANFRFFAQTGWDGESYNYPYFVDNGYAIDTNFEDAGDGDNNFKFIGESGEYFIVVDHANKEVRLELAQVPALYVPGAHQGWNPGDAYKVFSMNDDGVYTGYVNFTDSSTEFKVTGQPNWDGPNYGGTSISNSGTLDSSVGDNLVFSGTAGAYLLTADVNEMTWKLEEATDWEATANAWGVVGNAVGSWDDDVDMAFNQTNGLLELETTLTDGEIKFRANDGWALNYGDSDGDGVLGNGDGNIAVTAGKYKITLDFRNPAQATYKLELQ